MKLNRSIIILFINWNNASEYIWRSIFLCATVLGIIRNYISFRSFLSLDEQTFTFFIGKFFFSYSYSFGTISVPRVVDRENEIKSRTQCVKINLSGTITRSKPFPFTEIKITYFNPPRYYPFVTRHPVYTVELVQLVGAAHEEGGREGGRAVTREPSCVMALSSVRCLLPRDPRHPSNYPQIH